ncbi:MAG: serine/threonine protein kinase [Muribaculaceae bacterium]|nr:serine/threonine protein kinase [Muribaculaceae bacterium]
MQLKTNSRLQSGKYRIIRVLGQGGFGITYLAENILLGKKVAIKEFFPKDFCGRDNTSHLTLGTQNNAETVSKLKHRFLKEAQNISKLNHSGIVHIHDVFEENNTAYYVMDYIEGENLNEMVKRNGPLPEDKAVSYIKKVGEALDYIHSRNMTHFDVKPANIVVRKADDQPILIDFGLSKQYDSQGDATSTLMQGVSQGYSPLELYNYGSVSSFSPQTDVYSLAATLYFLVSGKTPPTPSEIMENGLKFSPSFPISLQKGIKDGLAPLRKHRPTSISSFIDGMIQNEETVIIPDTSSDSNKKSRSNSWVWILLVCIIAIGFVVGIVLSNVKDETSNDNVSGLFYDKSQLQVGDYVYEDLGGYSHSPISGHKPFSRVISTGLHPQCITLQPIAKCSMNDQDIYVSEFRTTHNAAHIPSVEEWIDVSRKIYGIPDYKNEIWQCPFASNGISVTHPYDHITIGINRPEGFSYGGDITGKMMHDFSGDGWTSNRSQETTGPSYNNTQTCTHSRIFTPGRGVTECVSDTNETKNLYMIYNL